MSSPQQYLSSQQTITIISKEIEQGKTNCIDVLQSCFEKIDQLESTLHAWVILERDAAFQQAQLLDDELAAGNSRGALHGIPIGIKDIIDVAGMPTAAGADWRKDAIAKVDAPLVKQLRDAGAVIMGKTVTTQFACFDPSITCNPWDITKTPGGSSSGSAVAVATGMCMGAIGTQTGGSITRPASFCGVCGFKPTLGKIDTTGIVPISHQLDHAGVIAQTVRDLWLMYDVLTGMDTDKDQFSQSTFSIGLFLNLCYDNIDPMMLEMFFNIILELEMVDVDVQMIELPELSSQVIDHHWSIMAHNAAQYHAPFLKDHAEDYLPGMRKIIEEGMSVSQEMYQQAIKHQHQLRQEIQTCFSQCDILVTPATLGAAPDRATTGDPCMNSPWSYTGFPTISFPINRGSAELPLAIQLIGQPNEEEKLFQIAQQLESFVASFEV